MTRERLSSGTIFWEKYKGYFYFFKIILDFKDVEKRGYRGEKGDILLESKNNLMFDTSNTRYLVQIFDGRYENPILIKNTPLLINGILMGNDFQSKRYYEGEGWEIYSKENINPHELDCYEEVADDNLPYRKPNLFIKGNINLPYFSKLTKNNKRNHCSFQSTELCDLAQHLMGFGELNRMGTMYLYEDDLRNNPELREKIYSTIGEDPNMSWYDLSMKHGFDLNVLFEEQEVEDKPLRLVSENNDKGFPKELLYDFLWRLNENAAKTEEEFKSSANMYNEDIAGNNLTPYWNNIIFPKQQLFIQLEYVDKLDKDVFKQVLLETENPEGFTFFELTYQMQLKIGRVNADHKFFEGLHYLSEKKESGELIPVYSILLGS